MCACVFTSTMSRTCPVLGRIRQDSRGAVSKPLPGPEPPGPAAARTSAGHDGGREAGPSLVVCLHADLMRTWKPVGAVLLSQW